MAGLNKLQMQVWGGKRENPIFSGLDIFDIYGLVKTPISTQNIFMLIFRSDGGEANYRAVYWDSNGLFSDSSPVSAIGGGVAVTTFGAIKGSYDWSNTVLYGHLTGTQIITNNSTTSLNGGKCAIGGVIVTDPINGKPCLDMSDNAGRKQYRGIYSEFDSGNNWSIMDMVSPTVANTLYGLFSTTSASGDTDNYITTYLDTRTNKLAARVRVSGVNYDNTFISQQTTSDQKRVLTTVNSSKVVKSYLDGTFQSSVTYSGDYNNNWMRFLQSNTTTGNTYKGLWQMRTLHSSELTPLQIAKLEADLNTLLL